MGLDFGNVSCTRRGACRRFRDNVVDVDRAMRWGFGWELGPFEVMDAIGVKAFAAQVQKEGRARAAGRGEIAGERPEEDFTNRRKARRPSSISPAARRKRWKSRAAC